MQRSQWLWVTSLEAVCHIITCSFLWSLKRIYTTFLSKMQKYSSRPLNAICVYLVEWPFKSQWNTICILMTHTECKQDFRELQRAPFSVIMFYFTGEEYVAIFACFHEHISTLRACESDLDYMKLTQTAGATSGPYLPWLVGVSPFWCGQYKLMAPCVSFGFNTVPQLTIKSFVFKQWTQYVVPLNKIFTFSEQ